MVKNINELLNMVLAIGTNVIVLFFSLIALLAFSTLSYFMGDNILVTVGSSSSIIIALIDLLLIAYQNLNLNKDICKSVNTLQDVISNKDISESITTIHKCISSNCNVFIPPNKCIYDERIKEILCHNKQLKIYIICYGTGFFGNITEHVPEELKTTMELNVLMWNPLMGNDKLGLEIPNIDRRYIAAAAWECYSLQNTNRAGKTYLLPTPPAIRSCVILNGKSEALWASTQPYYYIENDNRTGRYKAYNVSPAIFYDVKNKEALDDLKCNILKEFSRLASKAKVMDTAMSREIEKKINE